jgi:chromosome segregation ATPase
MQEWQEKIEQEVGQLRQEVKQLREQRTEEMKAINVNVASADVTTRLDTLKQELESHSEAWLKTLQEHYTEHKQDISDVKTVQSGHSKFFEEHGKRLSALKTTQDEQDKKLDQILKLLQQKSGE